MNQIRRQLKANAKHTLNPHFKFFAALILPWFIISILGNVNYNLSLKTLTTSRIMGGFTLTCGIGIITYLLLTSVELACLNVVRHRKSYRNGIIQSTTIFHNGNYFIGAIMIAILKGIWIFLWSLLLIFPGYIKQLAYSQAIYIYKDAIDSGHKIKYRDAITQSRRLMKGHKWELFIIQLSFIGWWILSFCTLHLADLWVMPYYQLTLVNFYRRLITKATK